MSGWSRKANFVQIESIMQIIKGMSKLIDGVYVRFYH